MRVCLCDDGCGLSILVYIYFWHGNLVGATTVYHKISECVRVIDYVDPTDSGSNEVNGNLLLK